MGSDRDDRDSIRDLVQNRVVSRNAGNWERFRGTEAAPARILEPLGG